MKITKLLLLLPLIFLLSACAQGNVKTYEKKMSTTPKVETEQVDFSLIEEAETVNDLPAAPDEFTGMPMEESFSLSDIKSKLDDFSLNQEREYLSCAYYGVKNCETQTIYQKAQKDKDANLCDLLSKNEVSSCKDNLWSQLASMEKDISLCKKIVDGYSQNNCENSYYISQAVEAKDSSLCEKITAYTDPAFAAIPPTLEGEIPLEIIVVEPLENYRLEECKNQVKFSLEYEEMLPPPPIDLMPPVEVSEEFPPEAVIPENDKTELGEVEFELDVAPEEIETLQP